MWPRLGTFRIVENGGTIDKYIGDCLMALFRAPRSYGDDAKRAVKSALQSQDEVGKPLEKVQRRDWEQA
jgi:class 3 adenylate cyclase